MFQHSLGLIEGQKEKIFLEKSSNILKWFEGHVHPHLLMPPLLFFLCGTNQGDYTHEGLKRLGSESQGKLGRSPLAHTRGKRSRDQTLDHWVRIGYPTTRLFLYFQHSLFKCIGIWPISMKRIIFLEIKKKKKEKK